MIRHGHVYRKLAATALAFFLCSFLLTAAAAAKTERKTIRVGYPIQHGLTELDEKGRYSGYTYEYLQEVAQYTGWEYEFVTLPGDLDSTLNTMLDMLKNGELDLLGGLAYSDGLAAIYDYPESNYGMAYSTLCVLENNTDINDVSLPGREKLRVAVFHSAAKRNESLKKYCEANGYTAEFVYFDTEEERLAALENGQADALLSVDLVFTSGLRTIARFAPQPYYLATTKGNSEVLNQLNMAALKINEANPYFTDTLYEKYFAQKNSAFLLSAEEKEYIRYAGAKTVAVISGKEPIQTFDKTTGEGTGISRDVLDYITQKTGLQFSYIEANSMNELQKLLDAGRVDLVAGIPYEYSIANQYHLVLTRPYLSAQMVIAVSRGVDPQALEGKRVAVPYGLTLTEDHTGDILYFNTVEECLTAVEKGQADYCMANGYSMQYYTNRRNYSNLSLIPQSNMMQNTSIGVAQPADTTLLTIINKAVQSLTENELQAIVYRNTVDTRPVALSDFVAANPWLALGIVLAFTLVIATALIWYARVKIKESRKAALDNERYRQLCDLSNEYLFEYDYPKDRLLCSQKNAGFFAGESLLEHVSDRRDAWDPRDAERKILEQLFSMKEGACEYNCRLSDGSWRWMRFITKIVTDDTGKPVYGIGKLSDIQQEREERDRLLEQAQQDSLTGLYNAATSRRLITEGLAKASEEEPGALLIIDIDHFKQVNDRHGHLAGDQILVEVASCFRQVFRSEDILGRIGGDEFLIYLRAVRDSDVVAKKCAALQEAVRDSELLGGKIPVTLSIGAALTSGGREFDELYQRADGALYAVKNQGRNGYEIV